MRRPDGVARARRVGRLLAVLLLVALTAAPAASAQTPQIGRTRLPNGFTILVRENTVAPLVAYSLQIKMGTRWETRDNAGISNLLQLMAVRGTTTLNGVQIVEAADRMGGSIEAVGDADYSEISATALSRHWRAMLELVADVALRPSIPEGTLGAVRDFLVTQIRNRGEKPYDVAYDTLTARVFGPHPYAWDPIGLRDSVTRLDRASLLAHYQRHYVPEGLVLAVSGKVKAAEIVAEAQRLFGNMAAAPVPVPRAAPPAPVVASREVIRVPGAQAQIMMGSLAPAMTDPDYAAVKVLANVLGGGMAGRFFSELRDKQGLAYTTTTQYPSRVDPSLFVALLGTAPENVPKSEPALRAELERIQREPVTDEELRIAKAYLVGSLAMDRRTNARQAWYLATYEQAGVGFEFLDRYQQQVRAVTAADVQRVARRYLSTLRTVVVEPPPRP